MDGIFFLLLAFLTVILSIRLSYYGDKITKQTKVGAAFVGGLLIASITSLPEFVTSVSAVVIDNAALSFGDIVGSNMFNVFILAVYNIYFFKKDVFKNTSRKYIFECLILITDYIFIVLGTNNIFINFVTFFLFCAYLIYMISVLKNKDEESNEEPDQKVNYVFIKFILTAVIMVFLSIMLTKEADKIAHMYPSFSSSSIGAMLLGITTSLPEVVTTFSLLKLGNFNMAASNMLGSNIFNFLVLAISDIFVKESHIYSYSDSYTMMYVIGGIITTFLLVISLILKKNNKIVQILLSGLMILIYFSIWYLQFN